MAITKFEKDTVYSFISWTGRDEFFKIIDIDLLTGILSYVFFRGQIPESFPHTVDIMIMRYSYYYNTIFENGIYRRLDV